MGKFIMESNGGFDLPGLLLGQSALAVFLLWWIGVSAEIRSAPVSKKK